MYRSIALAALLLTACAKGGASSGASSTEEGCPKDLLAAKGKPCRPEGTACTGGQTSFTHLMMCSGGKWVEMEAPPPPMLTPPATAK